MTETTTELLRLTLSLQDREDGGLRISSVDVPGLHLSGADRARVWGLVPASLTGLLAANRGLRVVQVYLPAQEVALSGPSPRDVHVRANVKSVVVEIERPLPA